MIDFGKLDFGKHKGYDVTVIVENFPDYIIWINRNYQPVTPLLLYGAIMASDSDKHDHPYEVLMDEVNCDDHYELLERDKYKINKLTDWYDNENGFIVVAISNKLKEINKMNIDTDFNISAQQQYRTVLLMRKDYNFVVAAKDPDDFTITEVDKNNIFRVLKSSNVKENDIVLTHRGLLTVTKVIDETSTTIARFPGAEFKWIKAVVDTSEYQKARDMDDLIANEIVVAQQRVMQQNMMELLSQSMSDEDFKNILHLTNDDDKKDI